MSQTGGQQHLNAVRNETLHHTREGVEDTCRLPRVDAILLTDFFGNIANGEDGNGVVGRTEVNQTHQRRDSTLGATLAIDWRVSLLMI